MDKNYESAGIFQANWSVWTYGNGSTIIYTFSCFLKNNINTINAIRPILMNRENNNNYHLNKLYYNINKKNEKLLQDIKEDIDQLNN